jgi:ribonuclease Z
MDLELLFLGTAGSAPTARRGLPAILVTRGGDRLLFDCGEGTQRQLLRTTGLLDLAHVFISHFHADHVLGLPGMLKSFSLRGREAPLTLYGPAGLARLWSSGLAPLVGRTPYSIEIVEVRPAVPVERDGYAIAPFAVEHGANPALGYAIVEQDRLGRFDEARALELGVRPGPDFGRLHGGETVVTAKGEVKPDQVVGPPRPGRKIVLAGDGIPSEATRVAADGADVLVHEATFGEDEAERARETSHSTARGAAELARAADVKLLALTHVSPRYGGGELKEEARAVFERTVVPHDFDRVVVPLPERGAPEHLRATD